MFHLIMMSKYVQIGPFVIQIYVMNNTLDFIISNKKEWNIQISTIGKYVWECFWLWHWKKKNHISPNNLNEVCISMEQTFSLNNKIFNVFNRSYSCSTSLLIYCKGWTYLQNLWIEFCFLTAMLKFKFSKFVCFSKYLLATSSPEFIGFFCHTFCILINI